MISKSSALVPSYKHHCNTLLRSVCVVGNKLTARTQTANGLKYACRLYRDRVLIEKKAYQADAEFVFSTPLADSRVGYAVRFYYKSLIYGVAAFNVLVNPVLDSDHFQPAEDCRGAAVPFGGERFFHHAYGISYNRSLGISHYFKLSNQSRVLLVTFHGSIPRRSSFGGASSLPCFRLYNLDIQHQPSLLCFSDLLLEKFEEDNISLAWFLETSRYRQHQKIQKIICHYLKLHEYEQIIFHGSSGGGFISLYLASVFNQVALVSNSQFILDKHPQFDELKDSVLRQNDHLLPFNLERMLQELPGPKKFISYCNVDDYTREHHVYANEVVNRRFPGTVLPIFFEGDAIAKAKGVKNHSIGYPEGAKLQSVLDRYLKKLSVSK